MWDGLGALHASGPHAPAFRHPRLPAPPPPYVAAKPQLPIKAGTVLQTIGFGNLYDVPEPDPNTDPDPRDATTLQETALQLRPLDYCNEKGAVPNPFLTNTLVW